MISFFKGKKVAVAGGTGLIGQPLVNRLVKAGAEVTVASLDDPSRAHPDTTFKQLDLRNFENCLSVCQDQEIVFNLAGVKGSPAMTAQRPATFMVPTVTFSFNLMEAARQAGVGRYLFTSSVGVYAPADYFREDDVWSTFPSPNDRFAGWAKRISELQAEAYKIEYDWDNISIVRPANVYGPYDNFDPSSAMVIPSLIHRAASGENPLKVWGDGSAIRDFIHADDVALSMMKVVEAGISEPINLGSGKGISIKQVADTLAEIFPGDLEIEWDTSKPSGDAIRIMDTTRAESHNLKPEMSLKDGMQETLSWYLENQNAISSRYTAFQDAKYRK